MAPAPARYPQVIAGTIVVSITIQNNVYGTRVIADGCLKGITQFVTTRYFMLIPEACKLILEAATLGHEARFSSSMFRPHSRSCQAHCEPQDFCGRGAGV